jgi:transcription initiation factor IIE alpha subunit
VKEQRINVWAQHAADARWACPKCKAELALYDHAEERRWRHLGRDEAVASQLG